MRIRNTRNTTRSMEPSTSSQPPAMAVVTMPNFMTSWADTTNAAVVNSVRISAPSTPSILLKSLSAYPCAALLPLRSLMASRHSCTPSVTSSILLFLMSAYRLWTLFDRSTMAKATGTGHRAATPMIGEKTRMTTPIIAVYIIAPMSSGNQWVIALSCIVTSPMMRTVKSVGSFFEKYDRGSLLILSARDMRTWALSL